MALTAADIGIITDIASRAAREAVNTSARGEGGLSLPVPVFRSAVVATDTPTGSQATVTVDGDVAPMSALNLSGWQLAPGTRVMVSFVPPHGVYITQVFDPPHTVGLFFTDDQFSGFGGNTLGNLTGSDVTFIATPGHYYRCSAGVVMDPGGTGTYVGIYITDQNNTWVAEVYKSGTGAEFMECRGVLGATAGEMTMQLGYQMDGSGGTIGTTTASEPTYLLVEDLGPIPA